MLYFLKRSHKEALKSVDKSKTNVDGVKRKAAAPKERPECSTGPPQHRITAAQPSVADYIRSSKSPFGQTQDSISCKGAAKAVFHAVNLQRRMRDGAALQVAEVSSSKRVLTPDKLAAVGTVCHGRPSPRTEILDAFDMYIGQAPFDVSPGYGRASLTSISRSNFKISIGSCSFKLLLGTDSVFLQM
ncbi:uncharacterized protein ISCGN_023303 [Ixodes scapularis]